MVDVVRRRLIQGGAAAAGVSLLPGTTPAADAPAAKLTDIDHVIILMKENRSFDHYFGSLTGVRGFDDPTALTLKNGRSVFHQPDPQHPDEFILPFRLNTLTTNAQRLHDLDHEWATQRSAWNGGRMDNWIPAHRIADGDAAPLCMGYHTREDLPFYYALADAFTICDGYHCSMFGPTHPNRYFLMTGTVDADGRFGGPALNNKGRRYSWETYPERLQRAGITWRIYHDADDYYCNVCRFFSQYQGLPETSPLFENAMRNRSFETLLSDLRTGTVPQVSWIVPPSYLSEHPDYLPAAGENHTRQILAALWSNPALWARTLVILNYDENDGQFDHVPPPVPPEGTPGEFVRGQPLGLGFRVPCLLISPFSRGGFVCGETFDHTSTLRLLEARFGVEIANLSRWRRETCGDFTHALGFGEAARLDIPALPETEAALGAAQLRATSLPVPRVPYAQRMPGQEPGTRPRRTPA